MSDAMTKSSASLVAGQGMLGKIYFPRILFPITPILAKFVDFTISLLLLLAIILYYKVSITPNILMLPFLIILMMIFSTAVGLWLSALAIRYRDVKFAMPFVLRMMIYTAPILYSASSIPENYRLLYSINPLVGIIEGFRSCLLGTQIPFEYMLPGIITTIILFVGGALYFKKMESIFVDVI